MNHPLPIHRSIGRAAIALLVAAALVAACGDDDDSASTDRASPAGGDAATLEIADVWARTSPAMATAGAVYMQIANTGDADDALVGVAVDPSVAATAELHETTMAEPAATSDTAMGMPSDTTGTGDGMMTMRPVDRISVPAGGSVALEPGGYHVMLLDLAAPLAAGSTVSLTLTFEVAGTQVVTADVRDQ